MGADEVIQRRMDGRNRAAIGATVSVIGRPGSRLTRSIGKEHSRALSFRAEEGVQETAVAPRDRCGYSKPSLPQVEQHIQFVGDICRRPPPCAIQPEYILLLLRLRQIGIIEAAVEQLTTDGAPDTV